MKSLMMRTALLAGLALVCFGGQSAYARDKYYCMTDDGYGRMRPCSAQYKKDNPLWRGSEACMTDDGYGRKRPCSAQYKAKHKQ